MQILSLNSKKCSTRNLALAASLTIVSATGAFAATPNPATLRADIQAQAQGSFDKIIQKWEKQYAEHAVNPLLQLAQDKKSSDMTRYIALMGAAKLGGKSTTPKMVGLLKDGSWMIRSGALRALSALGDPSNGASVLPLLKDPALVVRSEAVQTAARLNAPGTAKALLETIRNSENYHGGKAQVVPNQALAALVQIHATDSVRELRPLLSHHQDPELQRATIQTLESLTGKKLKTGAKLKDQTQAWEKFLSPAHSS